MNALKKGASHQKVYFEIHPFDGKLEFFTLCVLHFLNELKNQRFLLFQCIRNIRDGIPLRQFLLNEFFQKKLAKGYSIPDIAEALEEEETLISKLIQEMQEA